MNYIIGLLSFLITNKYILYIIVGFTFFLILLNSKEKKLIFPKNFNFILLLLFGVVYTIFALYNNTFNYLVLIYPILMYYIGVSLFYNEKNSNGKQIENRLILISNCIIFGLLFHATINYFTNINSLNRNVLDIFSKTNLNATLQATFVTLFLSTFFVNIQNKNIIKKVLIIIALIVSLLFVLLIGSRTSIIIFSITSIYSLVSIIFYKDHTIEGRKKKIKVLISVLLSIIVVLFLYQHNTFNIKNRFETSHLYYRLTEEKLERADKGRYENQFIGVVSMIKHPFGTKEKIGYTGYAHNMWLDIGKDAGILCFALLLLFSFGTLKTLIALNKSNNVSKMFKIYFNALYLGAFLSFQVEPILEAIPLYFGFFVLINGLIDMYYLSMIKKGVK